jgi:hypothetical protein
MLERKLSGLADCTWTGNLEMPSGERPLRKVSTSATTTNKKDKNMAPTVDFYSVKTTRSRHRF